MAIEQLARPCWYARYDGGEDYENQIHYGTEPQAQKAAAEIRADDEPGETAAVETGRMEAPCWTARCDGECDGPLEDGEYEWTLHLETRTEIERVCTEYGWIVTRDGQVFCDECAPDCETADRAVTEQVPGQGVIDMGYLSLPAELQADIESQIAERGKGGSDAPQAQA